MERAFAIDWRDHIESKPEVMMGKRVFKGTRVTVEVVLDWLAAGWREDDILENYPRLTSESLRAVYALARDSVHEQPFVATKAA